MEVPRLHPDTIEEVKQRADIVDVVTEYVVLRKRGKDYQGLCPFHEEKTPSFSVSPTKQLYYCFGCGAGGNAIKFLMEVGKQSFANTILDLAKRYQVPIKTLEPEKRQELQRQLSLREQLYEVLALAANFYQHALRQPEGEKALNYLREERQLGEETIQQFQLGYAPAGWETLYRYLVEVKRYSLDLVAQGGLIQPRQKGSGYYDRFRDRLMIPITDLQGRVIGFGSRTLGEDVPKYLNSPETPLFEKSKVLFALDRARNSISKEDQAVVVEGYFDAIALHAAGIAHAVASMGTAFSQEQVRKLLRYTESKQVILNFDADDAGNTATQRAIAEVESLVYAGQVQLRVLHLPGGKDADDFLKSQENATAAYRQALKEAPLWLDWQIEQIIGDKNLKQADEFEQAAGEMLKLITRLEDSNKRTHYVRHCAELLAGEDSRLIPLYAENLLSQLKKPLKKKNQGKFAPGQTLERNLTPEAKLLQQAEALLLCVYLHCPEYRQEIMLALEEKDLLFSFSHHRFLWQQILELAETTEEKLLLSRLQDLSFDYPEQINQVNHLFNLDEKHAEDISRPALVIRAALASMEQVTYEKHKRYCLEQWQKQHQEQPEQAQYYFQEFLEAQQKIKELDRERQFTLLDIIELPAW